ncbi:asparaginase [Halocatena marina]|uniref:asparaginase n=1 Tax=Halocatena marina TaxID=2934937 RepID=UPI00200DE84A|nr:asparaginase [Halocatena marina]
MSRIHIIGTGGTIASTGGSDGATPSLSTESIVELVPDLTENTEVSTDQISQRPGFDMDLATLAAVAEQLPAADSVDGIIITHGTDTMAESAYALDLTLAHDAPPVVFTGAQRRPEEVSSDAPANLRDAVRAVTQLSRGVFLAFNGELHAARDVVKAHTSALETFTSPEVGPVASITRSGVRWNHEPGTADTPLGTETLDTDATVPIITSGLGVDGTQIEQVLEHADGIVIAGTGLGNVTAQLGEAISDALEQIPVVVASRCHTGATEPVYGTAGGGATLANRGVVFADALPPWKARIALLLALEAGVNPESVIA